MGKHVSRGENSSTESGGSAHRAIERHFDRIMESLQRDDRDTPAEAKSRERCWDRAYRLVANITDD